MSVGIVLPTRELEIRRARTDGGLQALVDLAVLAEAAGLDHVWVGDSPVARPRAEPFTLLGAVAGATTTVGLGTAALIPALRHPLHTAHAIATLDQVAPGRLTVAAGAGFPYEATPDEFAAFGVPFTARNQRLDRTVALWRSLWSAETDGIPKPTSPGGPPIWLAAGPSATNAARIAGLYDGWLPYPPTAEAYGTGVDAMQPADRPLACGLYVTLTLGSRANQDRYLQEYYGVDSTVVGALQACHAGEPGQRRRLPLALRRSRCPPSRDPPRRIRHGPPAAAPGRRGRAGPPGGGTAMTHFVLVHGAWHGGWCWEQVADATARRGAVDAVPAAVIVCSRSSGIPFADWATAFGWPIRRLDAGHDAMVTDPAELARMLEDCARAPRP